MWYKIKRIYLWEQLVRPRAEPVNETFSYTWSDQVWTVPYTQDYIITCKWAGSNTASWWLGQWTITLHAWDKLSIMVWQSWSSTSSTTYWFGGSGNHSGGRAGWWLSWVFTWDTAITASDASRALVIWWWAWAWQWGSRPWGMWGGETWQDWQWSNYWTAWWWWTQTGRWSWWNVWANQFNWGNGSWTYWHWGWGWWRWGNSSIWDGSADDDKWAGWGSGYVASTATNPVLTQWWGSAAWVHGVVTIVSA